MLYLPKNFVCLWYDECEYIAELFFLNQIKAHSIMD